MCGCWFEKITRLTYRECRTIPSSLTPLILISRTKRYLSNRMGGLPKEENVEAEPCRINGTNWMARRSWSKQVYYYRHHIIHWNEMQICVLHIHFVNWLLSKPSHLQSSIWVNCDSRLLINQKIISVKLISPQTHYCNNFKSPSHLKKSDLNSAKTWEGE